MIPAAGGTATQVTNDPARDFEPSWSPDGSQIAFRSYRSGREKIWVISVPTAVQSESWSRIKEKYRE
jgi:Tol biopolymer transport system component